MDVTQEKYRLSLAIPLEVVQAQVDYSNAQFRATQALYDYHTALGRLARAIGASVSPSG